jgi:hypothetical protein
MESMIPKEKVKLKQNKKLISLWYESKEMMEQIFRDQKDMTDGEFEETADVSSIT